MPILFDSSVYIRALRGGPDAGLTLLRWIGPTPVWGCSVVIEELYAGTRAADRGVVEKLERDLERAGRMLVPSLRDWSQAGRLLNRIGAKYGYEQIGRSRLTNDALIATTAARCGVTVLTANARDFAKLAEFCPVQWQMA